MTPMPISHAALSAEELRREILSELPEGRMWLLARHELLGGATPEEKIEAGELLAVRDLLYSILYVGIS
jgi:hypothetical protein